MNTLCAELKLFLNKQLTEFILGQPVINNGISGDGADSLIIHHRKKKKNLYKKFESNTLQTSFIQ